jgi:hypothetical protein
MASDRDGTIKCTFDDCFLLFKTKKQMKMHKWKAAEHEYCRVCDLDFTDWDAHIAHKVEVDDARSDGHHICCRFCGFEFNTREARNRHVTHVSLFPPIILYLTRHLTPSIRRIPLCRRFHAVLAA